MYCASGAATLPSVENLATYGVGAKNLVRQAWAPGMRAAGGATGYHLWRGTRLREWVGYPVLGCGCSLKEERHINNDGDGRPKTLTRRRFLGVGATTLAGAALFKCVAGREAKPNF